MKLNPYGIAAISLIAVFAMSAGLQAQENLLVIEEIVVTAQKRGEERLIDVPASVHALSEQQIEALQVQNVGDIALVSPSFSVYEAGLPGHQRFQIRGISASAGIAPTVGYYWDEVPVADSNFNSVDGTTLDLDRVEVLRGPQGTLYGEGSMGGTVRMIWNRPDLSNFQGSLVLGRSETDGGDDSTNVKAVLNMPLIKNQLGLRVAISTREDGGYVDNLGTGDEHHNSRELTQIRAKLLWQVNDAWAAELTAYSYRNDIGGPDWVDDRDKLTVTTPIPLDSKGDTDFFSGLITGELGNMNFLSSTGYVEREYDQPIALVDELLRFSLFSENLATVEIFTQEFRLSSKSMDPWGWTAGVFYKDLVTSGFVFFDLAVTIPGDGLFVPDIHARTATHNIVDFGNEAWAVFGELSYSLSEQWTLTAGLRYFEDDAYSMNEEMTNQYLQFFFFGTPLGPESLVASMETEFDGKGVFDSVNPRLNLSYSFGEGIAYLNIAKGFRSGGFNILDEIFNPFMGMFVPVNSDYDPDSLWTYELGAKSTFSEGKLLLEGAVYYTDWSDIQTNFTPFQGASISATRNEGDASIRGVEAQMIYSPSSQWSITLNGSYTDTEHEDDALNHLAGDPIDYVPEYNFTAALTYKPTISSDLNGFFHVDVSHQSSRFRTIRSSSPQYPVQESDDHSFLNARIGVEGDRWGMYFVARNLIDEDGLLSPYSAETTAQLLPPRPRTLGIELRADF